MLQFDLNTSFFNSLEDAELLVIAVMQNALSSNLYSRISNITPEIYAALSTEDTQDWFNRNGLPAVRPFNQEQINTLTICQAYKVMIIFSRTSKAVPVTTACSLLVTSIVSLCKRGQVSPRFIDKIDQL